MINLILFSRRDEYEKIGIDTAKIQTNYILISGLKMISITFVIMLVAILISFLGSRLAGKLGKTLREKVFEKVVNFSKTEMKKYSKKT